MKGDERIHQLQEEINQLKLKLEEQQLQIKAIQNNHHPSQYYPRPASPKPITEWGKGFSLENFIGLRLIQFIGIVVLVIGLSIGVKYAIDRNLISETMRIILAYLAGIILFVLSVQLKKNYSGFSALLFSGGMASIYFTTYAAFVYYGMFSFAVSFIIMILLTIYTVMEAIRYNRQEIAMLGLVGAYGIPFLISQNADRADLFFLYITLINSGVIFLGVRKQWKLVTIIANVITWILYLGWANMRYTPEQSGIAWLFTSIFFLQFFISTISYKLVHKKPLSIDDSYQLILNIVILYINILTIRGFQDDSVIAMITLGLAVFSALISFIFYKTWKDELLTTRMIGFLSLAFFVLFIYFNWSGFIVTLLWLLTSVLVFIWGFKLKSVSARMAAMLLMGLTLAKLITFDTLSFTTIQKVISYLVLGVLLLIVSFSYQKFKQRIFDKE